MVATAHIQNRDFFSRRFMKRLLLLGELTVDRKELVSELSLSVHPISNNAAGFLYTLALTADSHQEIRDNFKEYIDNRGRCPYNTNSLSQLVFCHGLTEGTSRYNRLKSINSQKAIKQINDGKSKAGKKMAEAAVCAIKNRLIEDPLFYRKRNKGCKEYYISRGITNEDEISRLINNHLSTMPIVTKEKIIAEHGLDRWKEIKKARLDGMRLAKTPAGYSKEATIFFDKLTETNLFDGYDLWYASSTAGEYWIRDIDDNNKYYYIDFCVPELKIAIEYHGIKYHPKHQHDTDYESGRFGSLKPLSEKWEYDEQKRKSILLRGYSYIEIWSDDVPSIDDLKTRLEEIIIENNRPVLTL